MEECTCKEGHDWHRVTFRGKNGAVMVVCVQPGCDAVGYEMKVSN